MVNSGSFCGIARHTMKIWRDKNIITLDDLSVMQEKGDNMTPPPQVGRILQKIQSGFTAFTADEWILLYSPYVLHQRDNKCWCYFVEACQLICQPIITKEQTLHAHGLIVLPMKKYMEETCVHLIYIWCVI